MSDDSKAVREIAKTTGKAIDATVKLGEFISRYIGGPIEQSAGIVEDKLKYLRWERQVRLIERASKLLTDRGLDSPTRRVPMQFAIPLLQEASLEEDNWLQDKWATLLVNAADASFELEVRRAYISILKDLSPLDAQILEKLCLYQQASHEREIWTGFLPKILTVEKPDKDYAIPPSDVRISLYNLIRLGLVVSVMVDPSSVSGVNCVSSTALAHDFIRSISAP